MEVNNATTFSWLDAGIVITSLSLVFGLSLFSAKRYSADKSAKAYFLAGHDMSWWIVGGSIFSTNIGSEHFVGLAGAGCSSGLSAGLGEWISAIMLLVLGNFIVPIYFKRRNADARELIQHEATEFTIASDFPINNEEEKVATVSTVPEWFERRFDRRCRLIVSCVMITVYVFAKLGASIFAMQVILHTVIGVDNTLPITIGLVLFTACYTAIGGTRIVMYTDVLQLCIFFLGGILCLLIVWDRVGSVELVRHQLGLQGHFHMIKPADDARWPFFGYMTGNLVNCFWFWCVDQEIVQRVLCSKNENHARTGTLFASFLKLTPVLLIVLPGMLCRALYEMCTQQISNHGNAVNPRWCEVDLSIPKNANRALPLLVSIEFPTGATGLYLAGMIAALMSSLSSLFNSTAVLVTLDILPQFFSTERLKKHSIFYGRVSCLVVTGVGIGVLFLFKTQPMGIYSFYQLLSTRLSAPVATVFVVGAVWPGASRHGAIAALLCGFTLCMLGFVWHFLTDEFCVTVAQENDGSLGKYWFTCLHFYYFAGIEAVLVAVVMVAVSISKPNDKYRIPEQNIVSLEANVSPHTVGKQQSSSNDSSIELQDIHLQKSDAASPSLSSRNKKNNRIVTQLLRYRFLSLAQAGVVVTLIIMLK